MEKIKNLLSIDWGVNHCLIVDKQNRVFSMGHNRYGKLGISIHSNFKRGNEDEEEDDSDDDDDDEEDKGQTLEDK